MNHLSSCALLFGILFFGHGEAVAQKKWMKYYGPVVAKDHKLLKATFNKTFEKTADGRFVMHQYYIDTKVLTGEMFFADKKFRVKSGTSKFFLDNGALKSEGFYENNKMSGEWKVYDTKTGKAISAYNMVDGITTGESRSFFEDGTIKLISNYEKGKLHGKRVFYKKDSSECAVEIWENGECANKVPRLTDAGAEILEEARPQFPCKTEFVADTLCGKKSLKDFLGQHAEYPLFAKENGIKGKVHLRIAIEKDGAVSDIECSSCVCDALKESAFKTIRAMPKWLPGHQNNEPVRMVEHVSIWFY